MWKFVISASNKTNWLAHQGTEICFVGRSNVGKSSLINALAQAKIAKTSQTPGRTRLINYFELQPNQFLVDLPGYGFAKMPKEEQRKMLIMVEEYLNFSSKLKTVFLLFNSQIGLTDLDQQMITLLTSLDKKIVLIGTKLDKTNQSERHKIKQMLKQYSFDYFLVSANKDIQIKELRNYLLTSFE